MDGLHFDALTRRLTLILSRRRGLHLLALLGLPELVAPTAAKKKKRKKKKPCPPCKRRKKGKCKGMLPDGTACPDGTCQGGECRPPEDPCPGQNRCGEECIPTDQCCTREDCPAISGFRCCNGLCSDEKLAAGSDCDQDSQCCSDYCRGVTNGVVACAATCRGKSCTPEDGCCRSFSCESGHCGGCGDAGVECASDAECCFSACTARPGQAQKQCLSYAGGRCEKNTDCLTCFWVGACGVTVDGNPVDICHDGVCRCPDDYDCCADVDCDPNELCDIDAFTLRGECKPLIGP